VYGEGRIVIAALAQAKQFLLFFYAVLQQAHKWIAKWRAAVNLLAGVSTYSNFFERWLRERA
jgi:hypothetical protein